MKERKKFLLLTATVQTWGWCNNLYIKTGLGYQDDLWMLALHVDSCSRTWYLFL